ncbi:protein TPX2 isoform X2 [Punica granatum]|uniref:Protein TPX2 isoform X2 n=1 Tax=Punica granatum TaxID=22663 RepID=A0A6P8DNE1_PUNGR|nr:protein TPX2 isoform X2 [Punica granatum]
MEKPLAKSALKVVKASPQPAMSWGSTSSGSARGMAASQKPQTRESTKPLDIKLHTQQRAIRRAMFNYTVATKLYMMEQQRKQQEKLQKMVEEEEIRLLRKEMIPRAQLMPLFDRPFYPQRSSRPLTVPREPSFNILNSGKCWTCSQLYSFPHCRTMNTIK